LFIFNLIYTFIKKEEKKKNFPLYLITSKYRDYSYAHLFVCICIQTFVINSVDFNFLFPYMFKNSLYICLKVPFVHMFKNSIYLSDQIIYHYDIRI